MTRTAWILVPVALAAGMLLPVQFGVNSHLRNVFGGPVATAAISFIVGTVALAVAALVMQRSLPERGSAASAPWWAWTGDMLGAFFVLASIVLTPRLGAATTIGLILTGQIMASIVIDPLGLIRVLVHERKALMSDSRRALSSCPVAAAAPPKTCGPLNLRGYYDTLLAFSDHMVANGFLGEEHRALVLVGNGPKLLLDVFARYQPPKTVSG